MAFHARFIANFEAFKGKKNPESQGDEFHVESKSPENVYFGSGFNETFCQLGCWINLDVEHLT